MADTREAVYRAIRDKLLEGAFRSPKELSRQRLAAALKTSPGVVQWALVRLEAENVLQVRPSSGTCVRRFTREEYQRLYELRVVIEPYVAARAACLMTAAKFKPLERTVRDMAQLIEEFERGRLDILSDEYRERDVRLEYQFHGGIADAAQHPTVAHLLGNLFIPVLAYEDSSWSLCPRDDLEENLRMTLQEHRDILDALRRKDPSAAREAMYRSLRRGLEGGEWKLEYFL
jgi:DNA-binding GntR family transcriptional regulator